MSRQITVTNLLKRKLLEAAAEMKSADEMEEMFGIPAAQCLLHVKEMLAARDAWSAYESEQLLLVSLMAFKERAEKNFVDGDSKDAAVLLKTFTEIGKLLEKRTKITEADLTKITEAHGKALIELMTRAFGAAKDWLAEEYPAVPLEDIDTVFTEALLIESRR